MTARFVINLRSLTADQAFRDRLRPAGYLVAPAYLTKALSKFAASIAPRRLLIVDNGRYDDVGKIASTYAVEVEALLSQEMSGGPNSPTPYPLQLDLATRVRVDDLVSRMNASADANSGEFSLADQIALHPTTVIGVEDIAAAVWLRSGLDIEWHSNARRQLQTRNRAVARAAKRLADLPEASNITYLAVASALDYDTAFDAGRIFASQGLTGAALGFGAFMADDSYTTSYRRAGKWQRLPSRMPRRYLRTVLVARGFWDGWAAETARAPSCFHFLGLGAPIMLGLTSLIGLTTQLLTFDATSPIRDAVEGTLYLRNPAPLKARTRRVAVRLLDDPAFRWPCRCPFCRNYLAAHPFNRDAAWRWRANNPGRPLNAHDLQGGSELATALPLLSEPSGGSARKEIDHARIGHNHWTVQRILTDVNRHSATRSQLASHQEEVVERYAASTNAETFADAIRFAYAIAAHGVSR